MSPNIELFNIDCMSYMAGLEDNAFDLAIVDPPYGIGISKNPIRQQQAKKDWDGCTPVDGYFSSLRRISKNQIIWGGNYFNLPPTQGFVIWDKLQPEGLTLAMVEFAWTSFQEPAKIYKKRVINGDIAPRIHPTQKPSQLYEWLLSNYAKEGDRILDTHLGSGSSAIAAHYGGFDFVGCEIDEDYYNAAVTRFNDETRQKALFAP